jgi:hypothetical protein
MSDYITMVNRIANELDDDDLTDEIKSAIQSAIAYYSRTRFWFNQVQFDFAIVEDDEYFDSTDDSEIPNVLQIDSFYIADSSGTRWPLNPVSNYEIQEVQNGFVKARPRAWASVRQQIRVYPIADSSYTATVEAWSRLSTLSADDDTNAWMVEAEELIRQRAKRILAMDITKEPTDAQAAQALEEMALDGLLRETQLRRGQRLLRVDPALKARSQSYDIRSDT